ncbi:MAG: Mov34/MPN/PAD-1 family protein [Acidimicrobiia bacterium]
MSHFSKPASLPVSDGPIPERGSTRTLHVSPPLVRAIEEHALRRYPDECCGALIGRGGIVWKAFELPNISSEGQRRRFLIGPQDYRLAESRADMLGAELIGFYHSHPDHPAQPSSYDLEHAWPHLIYVIASVAAGRAGQVTAWRLAEDRSRFEELEVCVAAENPEKT